MPHPLNRALWHHAHQITLSFWRSGAVSTLFPLAILLLVLHLTAGAAAAQQHDPPACTQDCPGENDEFPPNITIKPESGVYTQPSLPVVVSMGDGQVLVQDSFWVKLNGSFVTSAFQYAPTPGSPTPKATARGTIALQPGGNTLEARICDYTDCTIEYRTYSYGVRGVRVTPDGGSTPGVAAGTAQTLAFTVTNTGPAADAFSLQAVCRNVDTGAAVACTAPSTSGSVAAGQGTTVNVSYTAPAAGTRVALQLRAWHATVPAVDDAGWAEVDVHGSGGSAGAMAVSLVDLNSTGVVSRDECVAASAGTGAAYECGDLRLAHGVPGMSTLGRERAPVLIYNSGHAQPNPTVYADVTLPANLSAPQQVVATVMTAQGVSYTRTFTGADWQPGTTRRIGVAWDGRSDGWWVMPYTLEVKAVYSAAQHTTQVQGELAMVNRGDSPFGAGWWLAGLDQLGCRCDPFDGERWIYRMGDGSSRILEPDEYASGTWMMRHPDRRTEYVSLLLSLEGGQHTRALQGGGEIHLVGGRHVRTVSRLGDTTHFAYDESNRLTYVSIPRRDGVAAGYRFTYTGGWLTAVQLEIAGTTYPGITIARSGAAITSITDADGGVTHFGYADPSNPYRITSRTSRDTTLTRFEYDAAGHLSASKLVLTGTDTLINRYTAAESRGVNGGSTTLSSAAVSQAFTLLNGPRTDVADETRIWVTRRGAPQRIRDALGHETVLARGNSTYTSLVTEVRGPNARGDSLVVKTRAAYDVLGRVDSVTAVNPLGDGQNLTTRYAYDNPWDLPGTITAPGAAPTVMSYDNDNGNLLWRQQGGSTRRVHFDYYASGPQRGLLARVRYPNPLTGVPDSVAVDSLGYDGAGNLRWTRSPLGHLTYLYRDHRGRDSLVVTPVHRDSSGTEAKLAATGTQQWTGYDALGRVAWTESVGRPVLLVGTPDMRVPSRIVPAEALRVETVYDAMSRPRTIRRWSTPDSADVDTITTHYQYDRAGRKTVEVTPGAGTETTVYHPADGSVTVYTSRGHQITTRFDALGRMVRRDVPAASDGASCPPGWFTCPSSIVFPRYSTSGSGGFAAPAETFVYGYDALGNQVYAENLDARVVRGYYPGGALRTDSTYMRTYAGMDFTHAFGLAYRYDGAGRLRALQHPANLTGTVQADSFAYDATTGEMTNAVSRQGYAYGFQYDLLGQLRRTSFPGGGAERMTYDAAGRRHTRIDSIPSGVLASDTLLYDARGKMTYVAGVAGTQPTHFRNWYSGLGNLLGTDWENDNNAARLTEALVVDAMGNQALRTTWPDGAADPPTFRTRYQSGTGRVTRIFNVPPVIPSASFKPDTTFRYYDNGGNVTWGVQRRWDVISGGPGVAHQTLTRNFYGADGTVRVVQVHDESTSGSSSWVFNGSYAEYRYDALGRRIMERTRRDDMCSTSNYGCESTLTRFVWAGDQLLWELRVPGGNSVAAGSSGLDAISASGDMYGQVSYFHAGGIDRPLLITKAGVESVVPRDTWRGQFHAGTSPVNGAVRDCTYGGQSGCLLIDWPGWKTTASHAWGESVPDIQVWYGGLVDGMRDASGQMYMRNRYYDPSTGQFTQSDPIGVAGGLNTYGFANGDPVSYSDPYGLRVDFAGDKAEAERLWNQLRRDVRRARRSDDEAVRTAANALWERLEAVRRDDVTYVIAVAPWRQGDLDDHGGGLEVCAPGLTECSVQIASNPGYPLAGSLTTLAHELVGAYGTGNGIDHYGPDGAVKWENHARTVFGCSQRQDHSVLPTYCR
jgi:RHS repeat-associated protein